MVDVLGLLQVAGQVAQEAAKAVTSLPQSGEQATEIVPYLTTSLAIVYIQKAMKYSWLTRSAYDSFVSHVPGADKWAHRLVAAVGALWVALGLHFVYEGAPDVGYQFHLITPAVTSMLHGVGDFVKVFLLQQGMYDATQKGKVAEVTAP